MFFIFHIEASTTSAFFSAVIAVDLKQTIQIDEDLEIRAYYAGHVRFLSLLLTFNYLVTES